MEVNSSNSSMGRQISCSRKRAATDQPWTEGDGETFIWKLPDVLLSMILAKLCYSEHVRSERVSKRFKRVGLDLSWHDVTVLIQQDLLEAYESNPEKMHSAMQALLKRCKRLNELSLTVLGHVPLYIQELPSLKHLSIQSKYTADDIGEGVKRLTQLLPLKGLQSLCITFIIEHEDEVEDENQNTMLNIFCPGYKSTKPLRQLPPNIRVLRLVRMIRAVIDSEDENPFPLPDDIEPAGVVGNLGALSLELSNITRDNISRRFQNLVYLDLNIVHWFQIDSNGQFLSAVIEPGSFSSLLALNFSSIHDDEQPFPIESLHIGCPKLKHLKIGFFNSHNSMKALCKKMTRWDASSSLQLQSLALHDRNIKPIKDTQAIVELLLAPPSSLKAISVEVEQYVCSKPRRLRMPEGMPPGLLVYKDPNKLWNGFALPVLKSVLKEPPSSNPLFYE